MTAVARMCRPRAGGDRCPGVLKLHDALDGHLARVRLPGGRLTAAQLETLAAAARLGNGIVEITSRGNAQVRGLPGDCGADLADLLAANGLLPSIDHERARNVLASPVAGRHPDAVAEVDGVVEALDRELCADPALTALSGRFAFAVEDGSGVLAAQRADVTLAPRRAEGTGVRVEAGDGAGIGAATRRSEPVVLALSLGGAETDLSAPLPDAAAALALDAARACLDARGGDDRVWRIWDLDGGAARVAARLGATIRGRAPRRGAARAMPVPPGRLAQRDGRVAVTALPPLGRLDPEQLDRLADLAADHGAEVRLAPWRTLTLVDVPAAAAPGAEGALQALGLVTDPASGWRGLSACAGMGACRRAIADVRAAAAERAAVRAPDTPEEHWTACERRCGERAAVPVAVSAGADGVEVRTGERTQLAPDLDGALALLEEAVR